MQVFGLFILFDEYSRVLFMGFRAEFYLSGAAADLTDPSLGFVHTGL